MIDAERLDYRLECEHIHLLLDEIDRGLADLEAGRTRIARDVLADLKRAAKRSLAGAGSR